MAIRRSIIIASSIGALAIAAASTAQAAPGFRGANQLSSQSSSSSNETRSAKRYDFFAMFHQFVLETLDPPKPYLGVVGTTPPSTNTAVDQNKPHEDCENPEKAENADEEKEAVAASGPEPIYFGF